MEALTDVYHTTIHGPNQRSCYPRYPDRFSLSSRLDGAFARVFAMMTYVSASCESDYDLTTPSQDIKRTSRTPYFTYIKTRVVANRMN